MLRGGAVFVGLDDTIDVKIDGQRARVRLEERYLRWAPDPGDYRPSLGGIEREVTRAWREGAEPAEIEAVVRERLNRLEAGED
jgi:hypothetical protein